MLRSLCKFIPHAIKRISTITQGSEESPYKTVPWTYNVDLHNIRTDTTSIQSIHGRKSPWKKPSYRCGSTSDKLHLRANKELLPKKIALYRASGFYLLIVQIARGAQLTPDTYFGMEEN